MIRWHYIDAFGEELIIGYYLNKMGSLDTPRYMQDLYKRAQRKGVRFVQAHFENKDDLLARVTQRTLFNCTGYGAKSLFFDDKVTALFGHVVRLPRCPDMRQALYVHSAHARSNFALVPFKDHVDLCGPFVEDGEVDKQAYERQLRSVEKFFE